jgi:hypothetical protein
MNLTQKKLYYDSTFKKLLSVQKQKLVLLDFIQKLVQNEKDCIDALQLITDCPNPSTKKIFYSYCIRPNAKCDAFHTEMKTIQQQKSEYMYQKRILDQDEFHVFSAAARYGYLDIIDELLSENSCNYINTLDGRTVLYDAVRYNQFEVVKKLLPWMKVNTIYTKVNYFPSIQHSVIELATEEIKQYIKEYLSYKIIL